MANGYASLARALQACGDISGAKDAITKALEEANQPTAGSKAFRYVKSQQFRLLVLNEDIEQVVQWSRGNDLSQDEPMIFNNEQHYILRARILITKNEYKAALNLLKSLANDAQASGRNGSWIELLILQALALQSENQTNKAQQVLMKALKLAEPEGYVRVFVDEGENIRLLLQKLSLEIETRNSHGKNQERLLEYIRKLLASFTFTLAQGQTSNATFNSQPDLIERLTNRELEILHLLCAGLSNQEIAAKLFITNSTAKSHIHHIFNKIGVESRTQLIIRAKELSLV
jgi:LuxR family maltose regulon positive regulatory protein